MWASSQPVVAGVPGNTVARHRWNHQMESVRRARAMRGGIGQRIDDLDLLDDRARPPVRDNQR
jgi:hypothetical protein